MANELKRGTCSANGINPKAVERFLARVEREALGMDGFMLLKGGIVVAEGYHAPYTNATPHVEFSLSKSMAATALGFAVSEGKLSLDDSICKFFPEYKKTLFNQRITLRHLVTMTAGKMINMAAARHERDWIKIFFDCPPIAPPGKQFIYVNDNFYLISAIVSKVYGETLVDFLDTRLFQPLGIEKPFWEMDRYGYAAGGWGLYLPPEALAKIMLCYSRMGIWNGKQVIPRAWIEDATRLQVKTLTRGQPDVTAGYGYGFWRTSLPYAYRAYGLYGQFGYVFEGKDTVLIMNSGTSQDMKLAAAINEMCETLWDVPDEADEEALQARLAAFGDKDDLPPQPRNQALEEKYSQKPLRTQSGIFASMLAPTMSTVLNERAGKIDLFILERKPNGALWLTWREGEFVNEIELGMDGTYAVSPVQYGSLHLHACAKAAWIENAVLRVMVRFQEGCTVRVLDFDFRHEKHIVVRNTSQPDLPHLAAYYMDFSGFPLPKPLHTLLINYLAPAILLYGEPDFHIR